MFLDKNALFDETSQKFGLCGNPSASEVGPDESHHQIEMKERPNQPSQ